MRTRRRALAATAVLTALLSFCLAPRSEAGDGDGRSLLGMVRFGDVDALDAEESPLASFVKSIRNDGRFIPPMRTLAGPSICNPTFFGVVYEAWMEMLILAPDDAGPPELVWVFPVDSRDEYLAYLVNQGLSEYEGMDGVTVLRETERDGEVRVRHMEWLPGNVVVFGDDRAAVVAVRRLYAENSASRGLLARAGGEYVEPDLMLRFFPARLVEWRLGEPAEYWWSGFVDMLTRDLLSGWRPNAARSRLVGSLAESLVLWPRGLEKVEFGVWFEREGVEWKMEVDGAGTPPIRSQLDIMRAVPGRAAMAYAVPFSSAAFDRAADLVGAFLLGAAGGVVNAEGRELAIRFRRTLETAGLAEAVYGWLPPPAGGPEYGASRFLVTDWTRPGGLDAALATVRQAFGAASPLRQIFVQMGLEATLRVDEPLPGAAEMEIRPAGDKPREPYYRALFGCAVNGGRMALVVGAGRGDPEERRAVAHYRLSEARRMVEPAPEGPPEVRRAFVRMERAGASLLGIFDPVRFMQLALVEAADWRPRSPDQQEPLSTQLAREMLEYGSAGPWTLEGRARIDGWSFTGGVSWSSLTRLTAALGITESIGME